MPKRLPTLAFLGLAASLAFAAQAGGPSRGGGTVLGRPVVGVYPAAPAAIAPSFRSPSLPRTRAFGPRPVAGFGLPVYVGPPAFSFYEPPVQAPPVVYIVPAPAPAPAAAPPPPEREVVQHSDGRYELRGDGITVPYRWAWIPNPPPPPASKPKPDVRLYGWTDEQGVIQVTDRLDRIPERHRAQALRNASS